MSYIPIAFCCISTSYLLGSIPFSYLIGLYYGINICTVGSTNVGATNVLRTCGKTAGTIAYILDIAKGILAGILISSVSLSIIKNETYWISSLFLLFACMLPVIGHTWSIFLQFKGGKGVAVSTGILSVIMPAVLLPSLLVFILVMIRTKVVGISSVIAGISLPIWCFLVQSNNFNILNFNLQTQIQRQFPVNVQIICCFLSIVVIFSHKENLKKWITNKQN